MIGNIHSSQGSQPLSVGRQERAAKLEEALDTQRVELAQLDPTQLAESRDYGLQMLDQISAARFQQPAPGQSDADFSDLSVRLSSGC